MWKTTESLYGSMFKTEKHNISKLQSLDTDMSHESCLRSNIGISNHAFLSALGAVCLIGVIVEGAHT